MCSKAKITKLFEGFAAGRLRKIRKCFRSEKTKIRNCAIKQPKQNYDKLRLCF